MQHGWRTCLEIVPEHLGEIERKLAIWMVTRCQKDGWECCGSLSDWTVLHQEEKKAISRLLRLVVMRMMMAVGP